LDNLFFSILAFVGSFFAGFLGSLTGLGGGVIVVPMLTILFGVDIHYAAGASLIAVIGTSSGAASAYVKEGYSNIRIGMFLEVATTIGAIIGASLAGIISANVIYIIFAFILLYSAGSSFFMKEEDGSLTAEDKFARLFKLHGNYPTLNGLTEYKVQKVPLGFGVCSFAGIISGLLGIGGGVIKVLAMDRIMKIPFKVSATTSNFMIGVTAVASAGIYFKNGYIHSSLVMPVMLGVLFGAFLGSKIMKFTSSKILKIVFGIILIVMAFEMFRNGLK
jgi:uncharacterized protein